MLTELSFKDKWELAEACKTTEPNSSNEMQRPVNMWACGCRLTEAGALTTVEGQDEKGRRGDKKEATREVLRRLDSVLGARGTW